MLNTNWQNLLQLNKNELDIVMSKIQQERIDP